MSEVDPGEGWRLLEEGAMQEAPDEFFSRRSQSWRPVYNVGLPVKRGEYVRRPEITVTTSGPYIAIEVHRAALAEIERLKAELDAIKQPQPDPEPEWFDLTPFGEHKLRRDIDWVVYKDANTWRSVGISRGSTISQVSGYIEKVRCLLKDAPPELVAKAKQPQQPKTETVVFYEVISATRNNRYLHFVEKPEQGVHIPTGRTETREVVR